MSHDPVFERELQSHIDTWAAHCGAPKAVYIGHLKKLLKACVEQCARVADSHARLCDAQAIALTETDDIYAADLWGSAQEECSIVADKIREVRV